MGVAKLVGPTVVCRVTFAVAVRESRRRGWPENQGWAGVRRIGLSGRAWIAEWWSAIAVCQGGLVGRLIFQGGAVVMRPWFARVIARTGRAWVARVRWHAISAKRPHTEQVDEQTVWTGRVDGFPRVPPRVGDSLVPHGAPLPQSHWAHGRILVGRQRT